MSFVFFTSKTIYNDLKNSLSELRRFKAFSAFKVISMFLSVAVLLTATQKINAQDQLLGLASNGGPDGKGTAYSIKTNGTGFHVVKAFADWGSLPVDDLIKGSDGKLYGMTPDGGTYGHGTLFTITNSGAITILKHFNLTVDGGYPRGSLFQGKDGNFYGTLSGGTANSSGGIFKITQGGQYTLIRSLNINVDGGRPNGRLVQANDGNLYGTTNAGGSTGFGTIFRLVPSTNQYTVIKTFQKTDGANSYGGLVLGSDGAMYGMTRLGGTTNDGVIFKITTSGAYTVLRNLNDPDGIYPTGDLVEGRDGYLYGMAPNGGSFNGTIFKISTTGTPFMVLRNLSPGVEGGDPTGSLILGSDGNFYGMTYSMTGGFAGSVFKMTSSGVVTVLKKFTSATEGGFPMGSLAQGSDGALYGMTNSGGKHANGTLFRITTSSSFSVLVHFNGAAMGNVPQDNLAIGKDSSYFGVTRTGGMYNYGTIFKICGGITTVLKSFNRNVDGGNPMGGLVRANDGNLYGTTETGGTNGGGTIFRITPNGQFTVLRHLNSSTDGSEPKGTMILGTDGALYGMTYTGGSGIGGTIFKITTAGVFTVLRHLVSSTDGNFSEGGLVLGKDGHFYGMTGNNTRFFKITTAGVFTVIKNLVYGTDGAGPVGNMIIGTDGAFYGTMSVGGTYGKGVIFKITTAGVLTKIRHLNGTTDGGNPKGGLIQGSDGAFYGTTSTGGTNQVGTIFRITSTNSFSVLRNLNMATDGGTPLGGLIIAPKLALVANAQSNLAVTEDLAKAITLTGSGATNLTFSIFRQPKNGTITTGTAAARTYTPAANFNGKDSFAFTSNVGCFASAPAWVTINVSSVNDAPVLATIGNKNATRGVQLKFTAIATDVDAGQSKTFSLITPPLGAIINGTTGAFTWTPASAGSFTFKVRVTDNGSPVLSDEEQITVTVAAPKGLPPVVKITSPNDNSSYVGPATIPLIADAIKVDGTIKKVQFFVGRTLLATQNHFPYNYTWHNVPAGYYAFTAEATDNEGIVTTSDVVYVTVLPNKPPTIKITGPADNSSHVSPAAIRLIADAKDVDGTIKKVQFYNGTTLIATQNYFPYALTWYPIPAGEYAISAKAIDDKGMVTTSNVVHVTVAAPDQFVNGGKTNFAIRNAKVSSTNSLSLKAGPVPARNVLSLYTTGLKPNNKTVLSIVSLSGVVLKTIYTSSKPIMQVDVSSLRSGTYFLKVVNGDKTLYTQFVKLQ